MPCELRLQKYATKCPLVELLNQTRYLAPNQLSSCDLITTPIWFPQLIALHGHGSALINQGSSVIGVRRCFSRSYLR
jgi:hypothetical protein